MAPNLILRSWFSISTESNLAIPNASHHKFVTKMPLCPCDLVVAMVKSGNRPKCVKQCWKLLISSINKANRELLRKAFTQSATADRMVNSVLSLVGAYWLVKAKLVEIQWIYFEKNPKKKLLWGEFVGVLMVATYQKHP